MLLLIRRIYRNLDLFFYATDEATTERPGRSLVLDRLLELVLIEALRYRPSDLGEGGSGVLSGLADPRIGNALRTMHADAKQAWTLASLARKVGMSRSAFASRFLQLVGVPPIEYLANWRLRRARWLRRKHRWRTSPRWQGISR